MAKKTSNSTDDSTLAQATTDDAELAAHAIRCLYGCGVPDSLERLAKYDAATITAMAAAEREDRRDRIPAILAKASLK